MLATATAIESATIDILYKVLHMHQTIVGKNTGACDKMRVAALVTAHLASSSNEGLSTPHHEVVCLTVHPHQARETVLCTNLKSHIICIQLYNPNYRADVACVYNKLWTYTKSLRLLSAYESLQFIVLTLRQHA